MKLERPAEGSHAPWTEFLLLVERALLVPARGQRKFRGESGGSAKKWIGVDVDGRARPLDGMLGRSGDPLDGLGES